MSERFEPSEAVKKAEDAKYKFRETFLQRSSEAFKTAVRKTVEAHIREHPDMYPGINSAHAPEEPIFLEGSFEHYSRALDMEHYAKRDLCFMADLERRAALNLPSLFEEIGPEGRASYLLRNMYAIQDYLAADVDYFAHGFIARLSTLRDNLHLMLGDYNRATPPEATDRKLLEQRLRDINPRLARHLRETFRMPSQQRFLRLRNRSFHEVPDYEIGIEPVATDYIGVWFTLQIEDEARPQRPFDYLVPFYVEALDYTQKAINLLLRPDEPEPLPLVLDGSPS